ncbi:MAG: hypothetical protein GX786_00665 [Clostridiales bacterium]|nr:hypothetical protein [Clostridiales bacterium]
MSKKKIKKNPSRWRSKSFALVMMTTVIVLAVFVSLIADQLETRHSLRKDYSFNQITSLSEATKTLLENLQEPVHISLVAYRNDVDHQLADVLNRYQSQSDFLTWELVVPYENPTFIEKYTNVGANIQIDGLVVEAPEKDQYQLIAPSQFYAVEYTSALEREERYQYEKPITEAIVRVTASYVPKVMMSNTHREIGETQGALLTQGLQSNNFEVTRGALEKETLAETDLVMILSPQEDFTENEIENLLYFLEGGGKLFVTLDPNFETQPVPMPNLMTLLKAYGILPTQGAVLSYTNQENPLVLLPDFTGSPVTQLMEETGINNLQIPRTLGFYQPEGLDHLLTVENLLLSDSGSYEKKITYDRQQNYTQEEGDAVGPFALALLSTRIEKTGETSHVFAMGTSLAFTNIDVLYYSDNEAFLHSVLSALVPREDFTVNISTKAGYRPMINPNATTLGTAMVIVLPVLVMLAAALILWPRKHL